MAGDLDITATGSLQLMTALVASGLVDEYRLAPSSTASATRPGAGPGQLRHETSRSEMHA